MKILTHRFRDPMKIVQRLRRAFGKVDGVVTMMLYRVDGKQDGIGFMGSMDPADYNRMRGDMFAIDVEKLSRPFAIAIEGDSMLDGMTVYVGDEALRRCMGEPLESAALRMQYDNADDAYAGIQRIMEAEATLITLKGTK